MPIAAFIILRMLKHSLPYCRNLTNIRILWTINRICGHGRLQIMNIFLITIRFSIVVATRCPFNCHIYVVVIIRCKLRITIFLIATPFPGNSTWSFLSIDRSRRRRLSLRSRTRLNSYRKIFCRLLLL